MVWRAVYNLKVDPPPAPTHPHPTLPPRTSSSTSRFGPTSRSALPTLTTIYCLTPPTFDCPAPFTPPPNDSIPKPQLATTEANLSPVVWEHFARRFCLMYRKLPKRCNKAELIRTGSTGVSLSLTRLKYANRRFGGELFCRHKFTVWRAGLRLWPPSHTPMRPS